MILLWIELIAVIAILICAIRAVLGPTAPDRVLAFDAITGLLIASLVILGVHYRVSMLLDIALVYALLAFLGTLAISKYLEGRSVES
ncbi:MAG: monovalent cation/H+ antiporter complex subunit F [Candidatus Hadarchaeum sp.]|uniref:monovalent cation/H+ antiporter complex subunit F n=1 Tax=Candidatus Hadarchaeum sp. TaxID=2883567 RepID=UPI003171DE12